MGIKIYYYIIAAVVLLGIFMPQEGRNRKNYIIIMAALHTFVCGFRYQFLTGDLQKYQWNYKDYLNYGWFSDEIIQEGRNTGFQIFMKLISTLTNGNFQIFLIIIAIIIESAVAVLIFRYSPKPGDAIIVTGDVGRHGCTILLAREDFGIEADVTSDCAPLWGTVKSVMDATHDIHVIRDATRGGVGTVLYEIAGQSNVGIRLDASKVPVAPEVKGVCGMLGLEPLYLACEGRLVIMAPKEAAPKIVEALKQCPYSQNAAIIGEVTEEQPGRVVMTTEIGTQALLPQPGGELLPRIC